MNRKLYAAASLGIAVIGLPAKSNTDPDAIVNQHVFRLVQIVGFLLIASISGVVSVIVTTWESCLSSTMPPVSGITRSVVCKKFWNANPVTKKVDTSTTSENVRVIVSVT